MKERETNWIGFNQLKRNLMRNICRRCCFLTKVNLAAYILKTLHNFHPTLADDDEDLHF